MQRPSVLCRGSVWMRVVLDRVTRTPGGVREFRQGHGDIITMDGRQLKGERGYHQPYYKPGGSDRKEEGQPLYLQEVSPRVCILRGVSKRPFVSAAARLPLRSVISLALSPARPPCLLRDRVGPPVSQSSCAFSFFGVLAKPSLLFPAAPTHW